MDNLKLEPHIEAEITDIAKSYGFLKISFDTEYPFRGFQHNLASTRTSEDITYRYLFLNPAIKFYSINHTLFQKATKVLTLHEKTHNLPPFNSDPTVDDYLVQKQACEKYENQLEMMFLDILTCQFSRVPYLKEGEIRTEVFEHAEKFFWIDQAKRESISEQLSQKKNYKPKNLKKILRDRNIIPEAKSLWNGLFDIYPHKSLA